MTLTWATTGAASVSITASSGETVTIPEGQAGGTVTVTPIVPTTYTLTARAAGSNPRPVSSQVHVVVNAPRQPEIPEENGFTATVSDGPNSVVTLSWTGVTNAEKVILSSNGVTIIEEDGDAAGNIATGMASVRPTATTIYTLTAVGIDRATDRVSKTVTVTVTPSPIGFQRTVE